MQPMVQIRITIHLDAPVYRVLEAKAQKFSLEANEYIQKLLRQVAEDKIEIQMEK